MLHNGKVSVQSLRETPTAELIEHAVEKADHQEREAIRRELRNRPRPLSPLRRARAEVVLRQLLFNLEYGMPNGLNDIYHGARWRGLNRAQTDRALEDLIEAGQVAVVGGSGGVEVRLTAAEQERWRG